jgi:hypothetical protein
MQSSATSRSTVSFQSDKLVYYASVFVYDPAKKSDFINYKASLHAFESKYQEKILFLTFYSE